MPQSFHMPSVQTLATIGETNRPLPIGVLVPLAFSKERLAEEMGDLNYFGLARLKAGVIDRCGEGGTQCAAAHDRRQFACG